LTRSAPYEKSKFLGSGGSMVARLKLKEIDGRANICGALSCTFGVNKLHKSYGARSLNCAGHS
jgi:hypothetical protein